MGREAAVECQWAGEFGLCKVLLESHELIVRGAFRRRVPIASLTDISVRSEELLFRVGEERFLYIWVRRSLSGGRKQSRRLPEPRQEIGYLGDSHLLLLGEIDSEHLMSAIAEAGTVDGKSADLIVASVKTSHDLDLALNRLPKRQSGIPPLWIVYPKGSKNNFGESSVRAILRKRGFMDTKVASISPELTALRFIKRGT